MYYTRRQENPVNSVLAFLAGAATAAAAGAYFLYGPRGDVNRKKLDHGAKRLKRELLARMNEVTDITQEKYEQVVDELLGRYKLAKRFGKEKTARLSESLKEHWEEMKDAAERARIDAEMELDDDELGDILF